MKLWDPPSYLFPGQATPLKWQHAGSCSARCFTCLPANRSFLCMDHEHWLTCCYMWCCSVGDFLRKAPCLSGPNRQLLGQCQMHCLGCCYMECWSVLNAPRKVPNLSGPDARLLGQCHMHWLSCCSIRCECSWSVEECGMHVHSCKNIPMRML